VKQFTHAWLAFMAIKRLKEVNLSGNNRTWADHLIRWFMNHKDGVIQGSWYPDSVIKDMTSSHVLKFTPAPSGHASFKELPNTYLVQTYSTASPLYNQPYEIDPNDNLPDRCESLAHSVIDNLKIQFKEDKGSPVAGTDNHIAQLLFMLSHYVADAHMPMHCDSRRFSAGNHIHAHIEQQWDDEIRRHYQLDEPNQRFFYDPHGFPLRCSDTSAVYPNSFLSTVEKTLGGRPFRISWGGDNNNVWDFMKALCQHSYLLSFEFIPQTYDHTNVNISNWNTLGNLSFDNLTVAALSDAIDSIARIWFRIWRKYLKWEDSQSAPGTG
jgi:hypothetical protein